MMIAVHLAERDVTLQGAFVTWVTWREAGRGLFSGPSGLRERSLETGRANRLVRFRAICNNRSRQKELPVIEPPSGKLRQRRVSKKPRLIQVLYS